MTTPQSPWYEAFFNDDYFKLYESRLSREQTKKETDFVTRTLGLTRGDSVLDLCCGQGRHAVALAQLGMKVTGQDLSAPYLELAKRHAEEAEVTLELVRSDMREIPFEGAFDAIINMFTAFGYLESDAEDMKTLHQAQKALKPDGKLLLDTVNREWVISDHIPREWYTGSDGSIYLENRELDLVKSRSHINFVILSADGTRRESTGHHIRLYTLTEMIRMLEQAGLTFIQAYGGYDGEDYTVSSRRMIVIASKDSQDVNSF